MVINKKKISPFEILLTIYNKCCTINVFIYAVYILIINYVEIHGKGFILFARFLVVIIILFFIYIYILFYFMVEVNKLYVKNKMETI